MGVNTNIFLISLCILLLCIPGNGVYAFGAGNIPSFAYMEGRAFRHGDIEDTLAELVKKAAGGFALSTLIGKGSKFGGLDIKRVYFGNWLRDYSQAVDVAGLQKLPLQTIMNLVMVLGFLANGYATHEFEVTEERLGVYLPTEHIDNPKGYPDDARNYHPKLRPPVDPRELEIDPRTGLKNYIANENGSWDTSKALVRRTLERCIHLGRQHRANGQKQDEYEAYRLLGQALHTLEDFAAHSNFCELSLVNMGYQDVFVHVGDQVRIQAPNGKWVAPIVTGTFGSQDFIHSLLGEATDHISQASVTDLNAELEKARAKSGATRGGNNSADTLRDLFFKLPGGGGSEMAREMDGIERIRAGPSQGGKPPEEMSPQELHAVLWQVLTFRDSVVKKIEKTIEKIPGLGPLIEKLMDSISVFVFTTLEPFLKPLMKTATSSLMAASGQVINSHDQYEVFNDSSASDPTHSFLSKDHFNLILNETAGNLGKIVLTHTVTLVVKAWDDTSMNVHQVTEDILSSMFHPDFHDPHSKVQRDMLDYMRKWVQGLGGRQNDILNRLTKESVRNHKNIRASGEGGAPAAQGSYAQNLGVEAQHDIQGYVSSIPVVGSAASLIGNMGGGGGGGGGHGGHSHGGLMGNIPNLGSMGNVMGGAQSFLGQFSGPRRDLPGEYSNEGPPQGIPSPGHSTYPTSSAQDYPVPNPSNSPYPGGPSQSSHPGGRHHQSSYPSPGFPGGPPQQSPYPPPPSVPPSSFSSMPPEPSMHGGYTPSYGSAYPPPSSYTVPEPGSGFPSYGGGSSYPPPPGPPGTGFPGVPNDGTGFPGADPYGAPPSFPGGPGGHGGHGGHHGHHGHGYGGPPPSDRPYGW